MKKMTTVPKNIPPPRKTTVAQKRNISAINTVINDAVTLAKSIQKTTAAHRPPLKVQPNATPAPKGSTFRDCNDTHHMTSAPLVIIDIPPGPSPDKTIKIALPAPIIEKAKPTKETPKESRLQSRCTSLNKRLRACRSKIRRRTATIEKLEAEKEEITQQHLRTIELLKSGDKRDHNFEDILHQAVMKLS